MAFEQAGDAKATDRDDDQNTSSVTNSEVEVTHFSRACGAFVNSRSHCVCCGQVDATSEGTDSEHAVSVQLTEEKTYSIDADNSPPERLTNTDRFARELEVAKAKGAGSMDPHRGGNKIYPVKSVDSPRPTPLAVGDAARTRPAKRSRRRKPPTQVNSDALKSGSTQVESTRQRHSMAVAKMKAVSADSSGAGDVARHTVGPPAKATVRVSTCHTHCLTPKLRC